MPNQTLPKKLNKEPLIDAVFEIRFSSSIPASNILPGFLFAKIGQKKWQVESLPVSEIPSQMREVDQNLRYQPLKRIHWDNFLILVGDNSLGVGCKMPYAGWYKFKERIIKIVELLRDTEIVQTIERYSLKYVDLIEGKNLAELIGRINMALRVGDRMVKEEVFTIRVELPHRDFKNIIQIAAPVIAKLSDNYEKSGILIDVDTLCVHQTSDLGKFLNQLNDRLEAIHLTSKEMFFSCLTQETITYLEPIYE